MSLKKTVLLLSLIFFSLLTTPPTKGYAFLSVIDVSNLQQNSLTAVRTAQEIQNQITQIQNQIRSLSTLPSSSFGNVSNIYSSNLRQLSALQTSMNKISFDVNQISTQYDTLFPEGQWNGKSTGLYSAFYQQWNKELSDSAKNAMEAQSILSRSQDLNNQALTILSQSDGADGEVRQLQSTNQMLGVVSLQLDGLTQNLSTSSRLTATMAAEEAQKREISDAYSQKLLRGYDSTPTKTGVTLP
jgi:P-type conjugative transfer protein TrbJ